MTQEQLALLEEILSHPRFGAWAAGNAPDLETYWEEWSAGDPARKQILDLAREWSEYFHSNSTQAFSEAYIQEKVARAISAASWREHDFSSEYDEKPARRWSFTLLKSAAMILLASGIGITAYFYSRPQISESETVKISQTAGHDNELQRIVNSGASPRHIQLSDGSSVVLQPGSEIRYPAGFASDKREVRLYGEAFFEVVKNKKVPFYVIANQMVARVVGTSFRIKAKPDQPFLELNVKSGTVAVFNKKINAGDNLDNYSSSRVTLIRQNEKALFKLSGDELRKQAETVDIPIRLSIENISFQYENTPLNEVFAELESAYGVSISYNRNEMSDCSLTAQLGDEPLSKKIKWICSILEADYHIHDNKISISGKPCQPNKNMPMPENP